MRTSIIVQNLKCGGCAISIKSKLAKIVNVSEITVNIETSTVSFVAQNSEDALVVKNRLKTLGYPSIRDTNSTMSKAKSLMNCATGKINNL